MWNSGSQSRNMRSDNFLCIDEVDLDLQNLSRINIPNLMQIG